MGVILSTTHERRRRPRFGGDSGERSQRMGAREYNAIGGVKGLIRSIVFDRSANEKGKEGGLQSCGDRSSVRSILGPWENRGGWEENHCCSVARSNLATQYETVRAMPYTEALRLAEKG